MAHFLCHLGAHILEPFCSISILPKTTGAITYSNFLDMCKEVDPALDERGAITDTAAGMQGDTYYVQYHGKKES